MSRNIILGAALFAVLLSTMGSGQGESIARAQGSTTQTLLQLVNQVRAERNLPPFRFSQSLSIAAQNQANFNAKNTRYGHTGEGGSRPQARAEAAGYAGNVVENVVGGWDLTPQQGVTWWVNSPVHYNTLISTRYVEAGTGYAVNGRQHHYTLVVGRPPGAAGSPVGRDLQPADEPAFVAPIILSPPGPDGSIVHEVLTGHTLWAIAARYNIRLSDLQLFNNLTDDTFIRPGDKLIVKLADGQPPPPTPTPPLTHVVRAGETLWTIAARYRLELSDLLWLNSMNEETILRPADVITVRLAAGQLPPPTPTPRTTHIVQAGETAWGIAAQYGLNIDALLAYNGMSANDFILPGDALRIVAPSPVAATPTSTVEEQSPPTAELSAIAPVAVEVMSTSDAAAVVAALPSATPVPVTPVRLQTEVEPVQGNMIADLALIAAVAFALLAGILGIAMYRMR